jgi:hypothetical protein
MTHHLHTRSATTYELRKEIRKLIVLRENTRRLNVKLSAENERLKAERVEMSQMLDVCKNYIRELRPERLDPIETDAPESDACHAFTEIDDNFGPFESDV